jgi:uncharacterized repeat protein (TIGR03803 family)
MNAVAQLICQLFVLGVLSVLASAQTYTDLHDLNGVIDGSYPQNPGILAQGRDGKLYGTTVWGGTDNRGTVLKVTFSGTLTPLFNFSGTNVFATSGLTLGLDGNFYGTTQFGGANDYGSIFRITPTGSLTILHSFTGPSPGDGVGPTGAPVQGKDGNYYGAVNTAGPNSCAASAYRITPTGTFKTLSSSVPGCSSAPLVLGVDGNFYGTTNSGGIYGLPHGYGTVYKMTPTGAVKVLYNFDNVHGAYPAARIIQASDGNFYGTTWQGGSHGFGVVFKITPIGSLSLLHEFDGTDGCSPYAGLVAANDGNLYGATYNCGDSNAGVLFKITKTGTYTVLASFDITHGGYPSPTPIQSTSGKIYGLTNQGGATGEGVFYSLDVGLKPFTKLMTNSGKSGQLVQILGQAFTGTSSVRFGTGAATFTVVSDTYLTAKVPATGTTGAVTVTTPTGTLTGNTTFKVIPTLTSFNPITGTVGTSVVLTGTALSQTSKVTFGGVKATSFTINSATQVTATVPVGAKTGKIAVTTPGGTAGKGTFTVY